jgi:hypothetical protein
MPSIKNEAANFGTRSKQLFGAIGNVFKPSTWKAVDEAAANAAPAKILTEKSGFISKTVGGSMRAGYKVVEFPFAVAMKPINGMVHGLGNFVKGSPRTTLVLGTAALVAGIVHVFSKNSSQKLQAQSEAVEQLQAMQAQAAMQQASYPISYMNSASQADVDAKIAADRAAGTAPTSQTAAVAARQTAPEASPAV